MTLLRIMIVGGPGSGKTWLAGKLGKQLGLPVYSVDDVIHDPAGKLRPAAEIDASMRALAVQDRWIIEGGNTRTYSERAQRAHLIVRLAPSLLLRIYRVFRRDGFSLPLLRWTLRYGAVFGEKDRALAEANTGYVELRSRRDIAHFLSGNAGRL